MSVRRTRRTRLSAALVAAPLALTLVACGGDDDTDTDTRSDDAPASGTASPADETPQDDQAGSTSQPAGDTDGLLAAATTALGEVSGATVFSVDAEPTGWEVTLVAADGTESEVAVAADGTVARGPVTDPDDSGADEADDLAERRQLLKDATVDHAAAVAAAQSSNPGAVVTGVDLDLDAGRATWDVQLGEDTPDELTVTVDATTGEVIGTERDD
ncbi:PepSY domain-containing protein [Nocardioides lijunqiniae]|uniref:PepSY domain-containing protein n=1 Tax=Nocardioides lijunqiniae TaxID=2760832 RepID=UPI001878CAF4|nr:PepSY domain-containing protein [Nocardioides lijunqiniae]